MKNEGDKALHTDPHKEAGMQGDCKCGVGPTDEHVVPTQQTQLSIQDKRGRGACEWGQQKTAVHAHKRGLGSSLLNTSPYTPSFRIHGKKTVLERSSDIHAAGRAPPWRQPGLML